MIDPDLQMSVEMDRALHEFQKINESEGLSEADKQQLKDAYVENYLEPQARELLKEKLAQRAAIAERAARRHTKFYNRHKTQSPPATP
jgi:hypothetical protein